MGTHNIPCRSIFNYRLSIFNRLKTIQILIPFCISFTKLKFSRHFSILPKFFTLLAQIMCCSPYTYTIISARSVAMSLLFWLYDFSPFLKTQPHKEFSNLTSPIKELVLGFVDLQCMFLIFINLYCWNFISFLQLSLGWLFYIF